MKKYARRAALFFAVLLALYGLNWGAMLFTHGLSPKRYAVEYGEDGAYRLEKYESSNSLYASIAYWDDGAVFFELYDNITNKRLYRSKVFSFYGTLDGYVFIPTKKHPDCVHITGGIEARRNFLGIWYDPYWYNPFDTSEGRGRSGTCP